ncbi:hypothetical protein JCM2811A_50220 [Methylorubrum rhodinum]
MSTSTKASRRERDRGKKKAEACEVPDAGQGSVLLRSVISRSKPAAGFEAIFQEVAHFQLSHARTTASPKKKGTAEAVPIHQRPRKIEASRWSRPRGAGGGSLCPGLCPI